MRNIQIALLIAVFVSHALLFLALRIKTLFSEKHDLALNQQDIKNLL